MDADRGRRLAVFRGQAAACDSCRADEDPPLLHQHDGRWARPLFHLEATCRSGMLFVAEAPNLDDTFDPRKGRLTISPETDPSGKAFHELLESVGLAPEDVLVTNAVLCLPSKRNGKHPVSRRQVVRCSPWLKMLIEQVAPREVVTLGGKALSAITAIEPHRLTLRSGVGKVTPWFSRLLLPLYHPGRLGQVTRRKEQQVEDIQVLKAHLNARQLNGGSICDHKGA